MSFLTASTASTRFTSSSTTAAIRGRERKSIEEKMASKVLVSSFGHIEAMANAVA
jgi:hypothetical protein